MMATPDIGGGALRGAVDLSSLVARRNAPAAPGSPGGTPTAPSGSGPAVPALVLDATEETFGQVLELSRIVPVIVQLDAGASEPGSPLGDLLERAVTSLAGRMLLVRVDVGAEPSIAQAFGVQTVPTVAAIIGGRSMPLFQGALPEREVLSVLQQVLDFSAQNGVTGTLTVAPAADASSDGDPVPEPLPPLHQEAFDAIERGDFDAAIAAYRKALVQNPRDEDASAGLAQVSLLARLAGQDASVVRAAAAERPDDVDAQTGVADLDIAGGHVDDAFDRLLDLFARLAGDERETVRTRLLEYFALVGAADPRVLVARRRLASLLY